MNLKSGVCSVCDDGVMKPLVRGLCGYHYWSGKRLSVKKVSDKRKVLNKDYSLLRRDFLERHVVCGGGFVGCSYYSVDVHHMRGRVGSLYLDVSTWVGLCRSCHDYVHRFNLKSLGVMLF